MALAPISAGFQSLPLLPTSKVVPAGADSQDWWACVCSGTLWVSPTNSPVRLGLSSAAASTPTDVFNQRFEALFPHTGALGFVFCLVPQLSLPVYLRANVGPPGPQSAASQGLPAAALLRVLSARLPVSAPPASLDESFFNSLVSDFHTVQFSVSSGCFCF